MDMKKVVIESSFILNKPTGMGAFLVTCMKALNYCNIEYETVCLDIPNHYKFKFIFHTLWQNTVLFLKTLENKYDIMFFPAFIMPFITNKKTKYITTILDLCYLRKTEMKRYYRYIYNLSTIIALKRATVIITISETIKQEIIKYYNIKPDRIKTIYCSLTDNFINNCNKTTDILKRYNLNNKGYLLSVATLNKRKNIPELIKAFEKISEKYPDLKLVLVGGMGNEEKEKLTKHRNIIFTGYISDEDIPTLYKNALLYIYPSLYEGFGIPLIEAQYCGCPVLCSDIPVFREVAFDGAEFCPPNADNMAEKIEFLMNNTTRQTELVKLGHENVKRFSVDKIAMQIKSAISE